ncbi:MAG: prolipoprotein diacylglyceryl transferase [Candidatus Krumholzibacteria bacterium]|nr:prolipoprotein diacylglyceryl transferase [Candidatus Krumholzibacteria bacterium]
MHPVLIDIGPLQIRSYGFMLALSFLAGMYLAARRAKRAGVEPQHILDLSVYIILAAVVGSRLLYVVFHLDEFSSPVEFFALWRGGATFYGGMLAAMLVSYAFLARKRLSFLRVADITAPSVALGVAITRVGCFMSGCCYGKPTTLAWGVTFPPDSAAGQSAAEAAHALGLTTVALHPAQLYASAYGLVILAALLALEPRLRARRGATLGLLLVLYGVARFAVDFVRSYEANARVVFGLTFNQLISIALFALGVFLMVQRPASAGAGRS